MPIASTTYGVPFCDPFLRERTWVTVGVKTHVTPETGEGGDCAVAVVQGQAIQLRGNLGGDIRSDRGQARFHLESLPVRIEGVRDSRCPLAQ